MATREYISITDTAKIIRAELAKHFPGIKFSVRSQSYSMGSHVNVRWTDGPPTRLVDRVINKFSGKTFDGMDDSTHYHDTEYQGRMVHFAGSAPTTDRHVSNFKEWERMAREMIERKCQCDGVGSLAKFGNQYVVHLASAMVYACDFREPSNPLEFAFRFVVLREED